jgi:hypothetical protein
VFSVIARGQIRETGEDGSALATAGLVCSIVFGVISVIVIIAVASAVSNIHTPTGPTFGPTP